MYWPSFMLFSWGGELLNGPCCGVGEDANSEHVMYHQASKRVAASEKLKTPDVNSFNISELGVCVLICCRLQSFFCALTSENNINSYESQLLRLGRTSHSLCHDSASRGLPGMRFPVAIANLSLLDRCLTRDYTDRGSTFYVCH